MIFQRIAVWLLAFGVGCALPGCGDGRDEEPGIEVRFDVRNDSVAAIRDVLVIGTLHPLSFDIIEPGNTDTLAGRAVQMPPSVEVTWTDSHGVRQLCRVALDPADARELAGPIVLTINPDQQITVRGG